MQMDRHTDTLIAIPRSPAGGEVTIPRYNTDSGLAKTVTSKLFVKPSQFLLSYVISKRTTFLHIFLATEAPSDSFDL